MICYLCLYLIADNMMNMYELLESIHIQFGSNFGERFSRHSANWPMLETRKLKYVCIVFSVYLKNVANNCDRRSIKIIIQVRKDQVF